MTAILIVGDHPGDRGQLASVLAAHGHQPLEVSDGPEALETMYALRPALVVSDILLPTVDGPELVRRMRECPMFADTPVLFFTDAYHERAARALARQCKGADILITPSSSDEMLAAIDSVLDSRLQTSAAAVGWTSIAREHLRLVSSAIAARIDRFEATRQHIVALTQVAHRIAAERDPNAVIKAVCAEARHLTLARYAIVGLINDHAPIGHAIVAAGLDAGTVAALTPPPPGNSLLSAVIAEHRVVRRRHPDGRPDALGLPDVYPPASSSLTVPIASMTTVYGWLSLRTKLGADEFTDDDERAAVALATHAGIAYEHTRLADVMHHRIASLENELANTLADRDRIKHRERTRLSRALHDQLGQGLVSLKMDLHWLGAQIASSPAGADGLAANIDPMLAKLDDAVQSVRRLARDLRPPALDPLGFVDAIRAEAAAFERRANIRCRVEVRHPNVAIDEARAASVFVIVREALTNALRHAAPTRITVALRGSAKWMTISVTDDGRGIPDDRIRSHDSLGLTGMRERAAELGGRLDIRRRRSSGTCVALTIPLLPRQAPRS